MTEIEHRPRSRRAAFGSPKNSIRSNLKSRYNKSLRESPCCKPAKNMHAIDTELSLRSPSGTSLSVFLETDIPYGIVIFQVVDIV